MFSPLSRPAEPVNWAKDGTGACSLKADQVTARD